MQEIEVTLNTLFETMDRIQLVKSIPDDMNGPQTDKVRSAALVVCAAVLEYVAIGIRHLNSSFQSTGILRLFSSFA